MEAVRIETTVQSNGRVVIENLPFEEGKNVEVIVLEKNGAKNIDPDNQYPLHGTPYSYEDPFSPLISLEEWEPFK
ncbi:MAG: hypothetical protein ACRD6X_12475 [Pyrinomonadaceae bacterium]